MRRLLGSIVVSLGCSAPVYAAHMCWVERVSLAGAELHVHLLERYARNARGIVGPDGTGREVTRNADGSFTLRRGEKAILSGSIPEDACSAMAVISDGEAGLNLTARTCLPATPCRASQEFIPAE
jgi:hypothetical protein